MQNSRQRGTDKGHKDGSLQESTERQLDEEGIVEWVQEGQGQAGESQRQNLKLRTTWPASPKRWLEDLHGLYVLV